jgi:hypothetical protein
VYTTGNPALWLHIQTQELQKFYEKEVCQDGSSDVYEAAPEISPDPVDKDDVSKYEKRLGIYRKPAFSFICNIFLNALLYILTAKWR